MAKIISTRLLGDGFCLLSVECRDTIAPGQFYMMRGWGDFPLLSRPISVFDFNGEAVSFLFKIAGSGTKMLSILRPGDEITLDGPHGNGWPAVTGKIALVGGGAGIAPLFYTAKSLAGQNGVTCADVFLGFTKEAMLEEEYKAAAASSLVIDVGGFITERVDVSAYDHIFACGPVPMMEALYTKCRTRGAKNRLWVSVENRMACGIGACLVCTCKTTKGNKKVCADGPVFLAEEVFDI